MKLPDATRYAKVDTGRGVPGLIDFLPKSGSSKTRRIKDYKKPTGKLYTRHDVVKYLAKQISNPKKAAGSVPIAHGTPPYGVARSTATFHVERD